MEEKGQGAAPQQTSSPNKNLALTGFFNDGVKRIDLVLVINDDGSDLVKEMRINFLMNIIQFGLEAEMELGKMREHRNLMFVKLHAPDAIIQEFGIYFNEKSYFKDSHVEFMNPIPNILGMANERELIKIVRTQYPGPDNYSTLERSNIVYKILLKMPFGEHRKQIGIHRLIGNSIIKDAFALHDGPYFIVPKQSYANMNARQVLFYEWLGVINVWKMQPIHMIHEYFGKRISYYFAFYEYFNWMLVVPSVIGVYMIYKNVVNEKKYFFYSYYRYVVHCTTRYYYYYNHYTLVNRIPGYRYYYNVCPECRNYTYCPFIRERAYCEELKFLSKIDRYSMFKFGIYIVIWGLFLLIPWRYRSRYLSWIWEESKKHYKKLVRPEYTKIEINMEIGNKEINIRDAKGLEDIIKTLFTILTVALLVYWARVMFRFSIVIWHFPRWHRLQQHSTKYYFKEGELVDIAVGAAIYTFAVYVIKMVFMILVPKITEFENNETFQIYERSLAIKMYAFSFISSFMILVIYTYLGALFEGYKNSDKYFKLDGYAIMNNGFGSSLDDLCITLAIMTMLEYVIFRIPGFFLRSKTDYPDDLDRKVPCWEREYKLKPITDFLFHKLYNAIEMAVYYFNGCFYISAAIEFALITCYSMPFPGVALFILIINIWDIRHTARQLLLECRRPLLINTAGLGFWKYLFVITALYAPLSNFSIILFQSHKFFDDYLYVYEKDYRGRRIFFRKVFDRHSTSVILSFKRSHLEHARMHKRYKINNSGIGACTMRVIEKPLIKNMLLERQVRYALYATLIGPALGYFMMYVFPATSNWLENAIRKEKRIKSKFHIQKGFSK